MLEKIIEESQEETHEETPEEIKNETSKEKLIELTEKDLSKALKIIIGSEIQQKPQFDLNFNAFDFDFDLSDVDIKLILFYILLILICIAILLFFNSISLKKLEHKQFHNQLQSSLKNMNFLGEYHY